MAAITRQRDVIDRLKVAEALAALAEDAPSGGDRRLFLPPLKEALAAGNAEIRRRFEEGGSASRSVPSSASSSTS